MKQGINMILLHQTEAITDHSHSSHSATQTLESLVFQLQ